MFQIRKLRLLFFFFNFSWLNMMWIRPGMSCNKSSSLFWFLFAFFSFTWNNRFNQPTQSLFSQRNILISCSCILRRRQIKTMPSLATPFAISSLFSPRSFLFLLKYKLRISVFFLAKQNFIVLFSPKLLQFGFLELYKAFSLV